MDSIEAVWRIADGWERLAIVALIVAAIGQTAFVLIYATRPWYLVRIGRALMSKSATLCWVLVLTVVNTFWAYPYERQIASLSICAVAVAILYQLVALVLSPRYADDEEAPHA